MSDEILEKIKKTLLNIDPVYFAENYLNLDGKPFNLTSNGYRPFIEIYRYIGVKALENNSKPIVLLKSRQVGGTTMASVLEMFFMGSGLFGSGDRPPIRVVHAFPQLDHVFSYSKTKLSEMISNSVLTDGPDKKGKSKSHMQSLIDATTATNDSLQFKQFVGGNHLWIESVGLDGSRLRGKTADVIFFDECQLMSPAAISNTLKILNKARYGSIGSGVQVYFGTPLQKGSNFHKLWNASSQQYFYLGCEKCGEHFPLYTPGSNEWENIWIYDFVVRCTHCGHDQDKRKAAERGKWVPLRNPDECQYIGFHINQLYMPEFTKEKILAEKPENSPINSERAYQNEVLGEFFHGETSIITQDQIREICGDHERKFRANFHPEDQTLKFLGIDIGARQDTEQMVDNPRFKIQGQSYSTAVIISIKNAGIMSIEFAAKFKKNNVEYKKSFIKELIQKYSINLAMMDFGYTHDLSEILQNELGEKFLCAQATGKLNNKVKYNSDIFPKVIMFEKDYWIADLYEKMKKGMVRFPLGSYEHIAWLIQHCTNMEIKPSISRVGDVTPHYIKSGVNDGFVALLNAYIAYKFYITQGFTNQGLPTSFTEEKKTLPAVLAYAPKIR